MLFIVRAMSNSLIFSLAALAALIPVTLAVWRPEARRDTRFWILSAVAFAGPLAWVVVNSGAGWHTGLAATLWVSILVSLGLFILLAALTREAWRLSPLLLPYLIILAAIAIIWGQAPEQRLSEGAPAGWVALHIALSVLTYGLLTLAAIAGFAVVLRERAMKAKRRGMVSGLLPSVADAESLQVRLLGASETVLGLGVLTGMATQYLESGSVLVFDHKTLLTLGAFVLIGGLLLAHHRTGLRGQRAARLVLVGYLLVTLGYPGVKFVRDILLG